MHRAIVYSHDALVPLGGVPCPPHIAIVVARPAGGLATGAPPASLAASGDPAEPLVPRLKPPTDPLAIVSAVAGVTAIVPVISQLVGLACGLCAVWRIRRARRAGVAAGGYGWAAAGIATSAGALLCWLFALIVFGAVAGQFSNAAGVLDRALGPPGAQRE